MQCIRIDFTYAEKEKSQDCAGAVLALANPATFFCYMLCCLQLSGDGVQLAPGLPPGLIDFALFLFGKLLVGNEFLHADFVLM